MISPAVSIYVVLIFMSLCNKKKNINSEEYIEEVAREKLDMYLPNERVYIDISK